MEVLLFALFFISALIFFIAGKDDFGRTESKLIIKKEEKVEEEEKVVEEEKVIMTRCYQMFQELNAVFVMIFRFSVLSPQTSLIFLWI